jgi:hypothetical protein
MTTRMPVLDWKGVSLRGPLTLHYRLQPEWYDHEFGGLEYEIRKMIEALDAVGGKVFRVTVLTGDHAHRGQCCPHECMSVKEVDVTEAFYPQKIEG